MTVEHCTACGQVHPLKCVEAMARLYGKLQGIYGGQMRGRPVVIPDPLKKRARALRREGLTYAAIARRLRGQISVAHIARICQGEG